MNFNPHFFCKGALLPLALIALSANGAPRSLSLMNDNWNFSLTPDSGSIVQPFSKMVNLPHDWSVALPFDKNAPAGNDGGYLPTGVGVYNKTVNFSDDDLKNQKISLIFEGVYERWTLKVNGKEVGYRPYGYSSVIYDITPYVVAGDNEIEVIADNSNQKNCRWYSGSGIYRHVKLLKRNERSVEPWSLFITTPEVSKNKATIKVSFNVEGCGKGNPVSADVVIKSPTGETVANGTIKDVTGQTEESLSINNLALWSPSSPSLYTLEVIIKDGDKVLDSLTETFGIRTITYSAEDGLRLNGESIVLNGGCVHHDNGILGAASYDAAEARKVRLLKEAGFNAVRTSHNPPSPAFLDECDRQGLLVIDEAFDGWRDAKNNNDYSKDFDQWALKDVKAMVKRDRNHPSVMAWSIGNEIIERKKIEVVTTARNLANECKLNDPTRPVTEALCAWDSDWEIYDPHAEELDIVGYNYMIHKSETDHERDPKRIMWQTESYPRDAYSNWQKVQNNPYIIGDFVWTAIDYIGESGIGRFYYEGDVPGEHFHRPLWPWHAAYCGDIDFTGWRKPISHYRDLLYNEDKKMHLAVKEPDGYNGKIVTTMWGVWPTWESWNWDGHEGKSIEVEVLSRYPKVTLELNGEVVGEKNLTPEDAFKAVFAIPYKPGTLKAIAYDAEGKVAEERTLETAGKPYAIRLTADRTSISADNQDISFVVAEVVDNKGRVVPNAEVELKFNVNGPGEVIGSGSADIKSLECYATPEVITWKGRAIAAVKSTNKPGSMKVTATSPKLKTGTVNLKSNK